MQRCSSRLALAALAVAPFLASGQSQSDPYEALAKRAQSGDSTVDFRELRMACMKSSRCQPRSTPAELKAFTDAQDLPKRIAAGERLLTQGFPNIEVHATLAGLYKQSGDAAKETFHLEITKRLLGSIIQGRDGRTQASAFEVITDRELYTVLSTMGLPYSGPLVRAQQINEGGRRLFRFQITNPKTGQPVVVFFNIDAFTQKSTVR